MTIQVETVLQRPKAVLYSGGRAFYGLGNTIYYSQINIGRDISNINRCYQINDPVSEELSDILDTDGGTIQIGEATDILKLVEGPQGILILAANGVWSLSSGESSFNATSFSLRKITNLGCVSQKSVVEADGLIYFWTASSIGVIQPNQFGIYSYTNLTEDTVESLYQEIPLESKSRSNGFYNRKLNQIEWFYSKEAPLTSQGFFQEAKDSALFYNTRTQGFFPQDFGMTVRSNVGNPEKLPYIVQGIDLTEVTNLESLYLGVHHSDSANVLLMNRNNNDFVTNIEYTSPLAGETFDQSLPIPTGYMETGHETLGLPSNKKEAPYVVTHYKTTEDNWVEEGQGFILDNQSSSLLSSQWDWDNSPVNGKWGPEQQSYRYRKFRNTDSAGPFNSGVDVITTKNKVLGKGTALNLRFQQEDDKDLRLLGYTVQFSVNAKV